MMTKVLFHDIDFLPSGKLTYSVIAARYHGGWIYVRHRDRITWEIAGGHIEDGESPYDAAKRELMEETGAIDFDLNCVATYSVEKNGTTGYGRLFFAEVRSLGVVPDVSEIAEIKISGLLPENLTYPDIQPYLFSEVLKFLNQ